MAADVTGWDLRPATGEDGQWLTTLHEQLYVKLSRLYDARSLAWGQGFSYARIAHPVDIFIVSRAGTDAGAIYIEDRPEAIVVESLEVLPSNQSQGAGSACLTWVLRRATQEGKPVTLKVHKSNPNARRLYELHGFSQVGEDQTHYLMSTECGRFTTREI